MLKRALVTGSSGFVGRHMVQALHAVDCDVIEIDVESDTDPIDALDYFVGYNSCIDLVVHAAAEIGGRHGIETNALQLGAYNLQLDAAMFAWAARSKPEHVVYLSSSAVYPIDLQTQHAGDRKLQEHSVDLRYPCCPDQTYGWTKLIGERLARAANAEELRVHVVRPFSGYGTDQGTDYPFGAFLARAVRRDDPFVIWGDGTQVRDWIHIDDVVNSILAVVNSDIVLPVNICTGRATSFNTLASRFIESVQAVTPEYNPGIKHVLEAPRGVMHRVGDPIRLADVYKPQVSLEEGVRRAVQAAFHAEEHH